VLGNLEGGGEVHKGGRRGSLLDEQNCIEVSRWWLAQLDSISRHRQAQAAPAGMLFPHTLLQPSYLWAADAAAVPDALGLFQQLLDELGILRGCRIGLVGSSQQT